MATQIEAANHLGITSRRFRELTADGVLPARKSKGWDVDQCRYAYIDWLREAARNSGSMSEKARLDTARAEKVEFDLAIARGEYVKFDDVISAMGKIITEMRSKLLSMPTKLAPQIIGQERIPVVKDLIETAVYESLESIRSEDLGAVLSDS